MVKLPVEDFYARPHTNAEYHAEARRRSQNWQLFHLSTSEDAAFLQRAIQTCEKRLAQLADPVRTAPMKLANGVVLNAVNPCVSQQHGLFDEETS